MASIPSIRIALASNCGGRIDSGFEQAESLHLYEIDAIKARELGIIHMQTACKPAAPRGCKSGAGSTASAGGCGGSKKEEAVFDEAMILERAEALEGITALFVHKTLHAGSALKLNARHVFTVKLDEAEHFNTVIDRVQELLLNHPPRWMRRNWLPSATLHLGFVPSVAGKIKEQI